MSTTPKTAFSPWHYLPYALVTVLFAALFYYAPVALDNVGFEDSYRVYNGGNEDFSLQALWRFITEMRLVDNGRFANIVSLCMGLFVPRWLVALISGCMVAATFQLMAVFAGVRRQARPVWMLVLTVASVAMLPWRNDIIIIDYALNYVYASAVTMAALAVFKRAAVHGLRGWWLVGAIVMVFVAGAWHEGFSVPVLCGLGVYALVRRFRLPAVFYILTLVYAAGIALLITAPAFWMRAAGEVSLPGLIASPLTYAFWVRGLCLLVVILLAIMLIRPLRRRLSGFAGAFNFVVPAVAVLGAFFILLSLRVFGERATWPCNFFAMVAIACLMNRCLGEGGVVARRVSTWVAALALTFIMACAIYWQRLLYIEHVHIEQLMKASPTGTAFYDPLDDQHVGWRSFYMTARYLWKEDFQFRVINKMESPAPPPGVFYTLAPTALRHFSFDSPETRKLSGPAGMVEYHGCYVAPTTTPPWIWPVNTSRLGVEFTFADGTRRSIACLVQQFTSETGTTAAYLKPVTEALPPDATAASFE